MYEDEKKGQADDGAKGGRVRDAPCQGRQDEEEGEEVDEGRVRTVPGIFRFCERSRNQPVSL